MSLDLESDEDDGADVNDEDNVAQKYFDPVLVDILKRFNDDEEVLVIGKILVNVVELPIATMNDGCCLIKM